MPPCCNRYFSKLVVVTQESVYCFVLARLQNIGYDQNKTINSIIAQMTKNQRRRRSKFLPSPCDNSIVQLPFRAPSSDVRPSLPHKALTWLYRLRDLRFLAPDNHCYLQATSTIISIS